MCGINIIRAQQALVKKAAQQKGYVHLIGEVCGPARSPHLVSLHRKDPPYGVATDI